MCRTPSALQDAVFLFDVLKGRTLPAALRATIGRDAQLPAPPLGDASAGTVSPAGVGTAGSGLIGDAPGNAAPSGLGASTSSATAAAAAAAAAAATPETDFADAILHSSQRHIVVSSLERVEGHAAHENVFEDTLNMRVLLLRLAFAELVQLRSQAAARQGDDEIGSADVLSASAAAVSAGERPVMSFALRTGLHVISSMLKVCVNGCASRGLDMPWRAPSFD